MPAVERQIHYYAPLTRTNLNNSLVNIINILLYSVVLYHVHTWYVLDIPDTAVVCMSTFTRHDMLYSYIHMKYYVCMYAINRVCVVNHHMTCHV